LKTSLQLINHASILIKHGEISLLSDPWYQGDAFHKGWNLIHELTDDEIITLVDQVTHIWISHEHPDHFSIMFFKKFGDKIKDRNIQIIFQKTNDKRVETFLSKSGYDLEIIEFNSWIKLGKDFEILCFKDGFYDSGLAIKTNDKTIINFNDCEVRDPSRCNEVLKITGECDVLISQFSYAAWKGGKDNLAWRQLAAKEKINTLKLQTSFFKPKVLVPFASYVYFSNDLNFYMNDAANTPEDVIKAFVGTDVKVAILSPFQELSSLKFEIDNSDSISFWNEAYAKLNSKTLQKYKSIDLDKLHEFFENYKFRIFKNNSKWFMLSVRYLSPIAAFKPVIIHISDLNINIKLDLFANSLQQCNILADISMHSESLGFLLNNTFGFDTLTVNGCFEEASNSGFSRVTRTLAIENLNNMGIEFRPSIILNYQLIIMFISRLWAVSNKIKLGKSLSR
jgi:UDP-MurNAc hydroxylase